VFDLGEVSHNKYFFKNRLTYSNWHIMLIGDKMIIEKSKYRKFPMTSFVPCGLQHNATRLAHITKAVLISNIKIIKTQK